LAGGGSGAGRAAKETSMRVLVTGAAGFIGSHVAAALLERGDEVAVLDDLSNGRREHVPEGAVFVQGDVRAEADVERALLALPSGPAEAVCHLAGQASTFRSFDAPSWDMEVNGVGTARMLEGARRHGCGVFVFASSMTAYGPPPGLPVTEDMRCDPISYYGVTKWAAERAVVVSATQAGTGMRGVAFRMFNVYGERQSLTNPYQGVLGIFVGNVLREEPIRIFGDGEQSRDFVYAGDVARAWATAVHEAPEGATVVNLGTGTRTTINELWRAAAAACGADPDAWPVTYEEVRPGDQRHMRADISAVERVLGWTPRIPLSEGLARTVAWAKTDAGSRADG
jgi:UDP-glucose 4-epimerase